MIQPQQSYFITGTDTGVGKSVVCAWLLRQLDGFYWKPIQAGLDGETDSEAVYRWSGLPKERFYPSTYSLTSPMSPHEAARRDNLSIRLENFCLPDCSRPLVVEGAGGVLVPLNATNLMVDLMVQLALPAILVSRTVLGTINHTLMSLECLRNRDIFVAGVILCGQPNSDNRRAIVEYGRVTILAEIPFLDTINPEALDRVFPMAILQPNGVTRDT